MERRQGIFVSGALPAERSNQIQVLSVQEAPQKTWKLLHLTGKAIILWTQVP